MFWFIIDYKYKGKGKSSEEEDWELRRQQRDAVVGDVASGDAAISLKKAFWAVCEEASESCY